MNVFTKKTNVTRGGRRNRAITTLGKLGQRLTRCLRRRVSTQRLRFPPPSLRLNANESDLHLIPTTDLRSSLDQSAPGLFKDAAVHRTRP